MIPHLPIPIPIPITPSHHPIPPSQVINFKQPYSGDSALHCAVVSPFPKRKAVAETLCRSNIAVITRMSALADWNGLLRTTL